MVDGEHKIQGLFGPINTENNELANVVFTGTV